MRYQDPIPLPPSLSTKRLPSLDGWRGISIILVLGSHVSWVSNCPVFWGHLTARIFNGNLGVRMFFTISGFIITLLLLKEKHRSGTVSLRQFYLRRAMRILPVYAGYLGLVLILQLAGRVDEASTSWFGSLTFTRNFVGRAPSPTSHLWSLSIEEQFYLLWPLAFAYLDFARSKALGLSVAILIAALALIVRTLPVTLQTDMLSKLFGVWSLLRYADCLVIGCVTAFLAHAGWKRVKGGVAAVALAVFLTPELIPQALANPTLASLGVGLQSVSFAILMIYTIHSRGWAYRWLNSRILAGLGVLSYSLYIWHFIFIDYFAPRAMPFQILNSYWFWIVPAFAVAGLSWLVLEAPARRRRHQAQSLSSAK